MADKFNGTQVRFALSYEPQFTKPESIDVGVTAVSPTLTASAHGLKDGDVIWLRGLNYIAGSGYFSVKIKDANSFIVVKADFSMATESDLQAIEFAKAKLSGMCDIKNLKITPYKITMEDATTNCDLVKQERGTVETGEVSFDLNWQADNELHRDLEDAGENQIPIFYQFRKHGGKRIRGFKSTVSSFEYSGEVNSYYSGSIGLKHQSLKHDVELA